ncbi:MAG: GNAT family N-acetyltransferase [Acetatifactor sp.]|nr:GNAT family N-acetyltransferase [Acetatifactor sp.]
MRIRTVSAEDAESFYQMSCRLDRETKYMLYEPGEREEKATNLNRLKTTLEAAAEDEDFMKVAMNESDEIVGYLWAQRERLNRNAHVAYIVIGILRDYRHQGIGTEFFRLLDEWAKKKGLVRLELTVECVNANAVKLYQKCGFQIEGTREKSMKVDGEFIDEYYMAKIFS